MSVKEQLLRDLKKMRDEAQKMAGVVSESCDPTELASFVVEQGKFHIDVEQAQCAINIVNFRDSVSPLRDVRAHAMTVIRNGIVTIDKARLSEMVQSNFRSRSALRLLEIVNDVAEMNGVQS